MTMVNNHELKMHALLWIMLLALCSCLVTGQETDFCDNRYLTINTYGDLNAVNVTCFGSDSDCGIFSSPPGNGCSQDSLTQIGSVPAGQTRAITSNLPYGAALCSNYQTSVQVGDDFTPIVQLPRATQAGKLFHTAFRYRQSDRSFKCGISALAAPANVQYSVTSTAADTEMMVNKYKTEDITFDVTEDSPKVLKVTSDTSVIVSCQEISNSESQLIVLEPISSQPLMIVTPLNGWYSITIADCTTNDIISDVNRVNHFDSVIGGPNQLSCDISVDAENLFGTSRLCATVIVPQGDNACVSVLAYDTNFELVAVGLSESKLTSQLVSYPYQQVQFYFAFSPTICTFTYGNNNDTLNLELLPSNFRENQVASAATGNFLDKYDSVECENPVYIFFFGLDYVTFNSGFQADALWQDFLQSVECENVQPGPPIEPPTSIDTLPPTSKAMRPPLGIGAVSILLGLCGYVVLRS